MAEEEQKVVLRKQYWLLKEKTQKDKMLIVRQNINKNLPTMKTFGRKRENRDV